MSIIGGHTKPILTELGSSESVEGCAEMMIVRDERIEREGDQMEGGFESEVVG